MRTYFFFSLGEYAALAIANVLSVDHALLIVAKRVRLMVELCVVNATGMIAINLGPAAVEDLLHASPDFADLSISCYNSPIDCVVSGSLVKLRAFKDHLDKEVSCKSIILSVPFGYHSSAMAPLLEDLTAFTQLVSLNPPTVPIVSTVLGKLVLPGDNSVFNSEYFARHCEQPVQFEKGVCSLLAHPSLAPFDAWIEVGPHTTTLPMLKSNGSLPRGSTLLGSLRKQQDPWSTLSTSLTQLYNSGVHVQWRGVFAHLEGPTCISLPSYPFNKSKFWVPYKAPTAVGTSGGPQVAQISRPLARPSKSYEMLENWLQHPSRENGFVAVFETPIKKLARFIVGHRVGGIPLCPASVYIEQVLAGVHLGCHHLGVKLQDTHTVLRRMEFAKPLVYDEDVDRVVTTTITIHEHSGTFSISSRAQPSNEESVHCHGEYQLKSTLRTTTKFTQALPVVSRRIAGVVRPNDGQPPEVFSTRTAYDVIFPRVVDYAKEYQTMRSITVEASGMEGCANVSLPVNHDRGMFVVSPVFVDTLLHVSGFVANLLGVSNDAYICNEIQSIKVIPGLVDRDASYTVYCNNSWMPGKEVVVSEAYAVLTSNPKQIVAHIKGMQFRRVRLDRLKRGLVHAAGKTSLLPAFEMKPRNVTSAPRTSTSRPVAPKPDGSSGVLSQVVDVISRACEVGVDDLSMETELEAIGVDSLLSIEILVRLRRAFPSTNLHQHSLAFCKTVGDIVNEVSMKSENGRPTGSSRTVSSGIPSPKTPAHDDELTDPSHLAIDEPDVKHVLASVLELGIADIEDDADFTSLGMDSLSSIEALHTLQRDFGLDLPSNLFSVFQTPRNVQSYVHSRIQESRKSAQHLDSPDLNGKAERGVDLVKALNIGTAPVLLQKSDSNLAPIFLLHDGSGLVNYYNRLTPLGRTVWGINNPHFATSRPWNDVLSMAKSYADSIIELTAGPLILGGGYGAHEGTLILMRNDRLVLWWHVSLRDRPPASSKKCTRPRHPPYRFPTSHQPRTSTRLPHRRRHRSRYHD